MLTRLQHAQLTADDSINPVQHACCIRRVRSKTHVTTRGLYYPLLPANPTPRHFVAIVDPLSNKLPHIDVSKVFSNPNGSPTLPTIVTVDRRRFLLFGYYDPRLPQNLNLHEAFPFIPWHGEIVVFSLGRRVRVLSRPGARYAVEKAIAVYIRIVTEARMGNHECPAQISYFS